MVARSPQTLPAHASILSGRLPFAHGVRDKVDDLGTTRIVCRSGSPIEAAIREPRLKAGPRPPTKKQAKKRVGFVIPAG